MSSDEDIITRAVKHALRDIRFPPYDKRLDWKTEYCEGGPNKFWTCPEGIYEIYVLANAASSDARIVLNGNTNQQINLAWISQFDPVCAFPRAIDNVIFNGWTETAPDFNPSAYQKWGSTASEGWKISTDECISISDLSAFYVRFRRVG